MLAPTLRAVVGMNEADEFVQRAFELAGAQPVDLEQLFGPGNLVGRDIPRPAAEIGQALGFREMDIGVGKRRGALPHAVIEFGLGAAQAFLGCLPHRHVGAERQARHRHADHEGEQQQEGFVEADIAERPGMFDRRPDRKAGRGSRPTVAVSRGPRRNAAHTSGRIARKPSGLVYSARGSSGLKAIRPTATRRAQHRRDAAGIAAVEVAPVAMRAHSTMTGVTTSAPAASPSHQVTQIGLNFAQAAKPATLSVTTPMRGADRRSPARSQTSANFATCDGLREGLDAARPAPDQIAAGHALPAYCRAR